MIADPSILLAVVVGLSLGLLGGGGSILTVPIFVYAAGFAPRTAVAMSLPVVGIASAIGAIGHWRAGNVNWRSALPFGVIAMAGAFAGAFVARLLSGQVQLVLLAVVMLAAAIAMMRPRANDDARAERRQPARPLLLLTGLGVGLLTGVVGVGGGFLIVPALALIAGMPMRQAIGTSLVVIAMNTAAGALGYAGAVDIPWRYVGVFTALAVVGILAGARLASRVSVQALRRGFGALLIAMSLLIIAERSGWRP